MKSSVTDLLFDDLQAASGKAWEQAAERALSHGLPISGLEKGRKIVVDAQAPERKSLGLVAATARTKTASLNQRP